MNTINQLNLHIYSIYLSHIWQCQNVIYILLHKRRTTQTKKAKQQQKKNTKIQKETEATNLKCNT